MHLIDFSYVVIVISVALELEEGKEKYETYNELKKRLELDPSNTWVKLVGSCELVEA